MFKLYLLFGLLIITTVATKAQTPQELKYQIEKSKADTNLVKLFQQLGTYYLNKPNKLKNDLDSASNNFNNALQLSRKLTFKKGELTTIRLLGNLNIADNNFEKAKSYYIEAANEYHAIGDKLNEALTWNELGGNIAYDDARHQADREKSYKNAYDLLSQIPDKQIDALLAYKDMADAQLNEAKYELAESELLHIAAQFEHLHYVKLYETYDLLAAIYRGTHNFERELFYRIECVKGADRDPKANQGAKMSYYHALALCYAALNDTEQCIALEKKALEISKSFNFIGFYTFVSQIIFSLPSNKNTKKILSFLQSQERIYPPKTDDDKRAVAILTLRLYLALKRYDEFGRIVQGAIRLFVKGRQKASTHINSGYSNDYSYVLSLAANYYLAVHQNSRAASMVDSLVSLPSQRLLAGSRKTIYTLSYKIDSIKGDYARALEHFKKAASIGDSINYYAQNEQIARMYAGFKTFQKEQAIQELNKKNGDQQAKLEKAGIRQNYTTGMVVMFFLIAGGTCIGFRNKQISNRKLKEQQLKINSQNDSLHHLLAEKEWLLKEVHHRVKNNLHSVICLLEAQAAYLENDALEAIANSQHRIYTMSLIHQKLYQSEDVKMIDMRDYIPELVQYLRDSFDVSGRIHFDVFIEPVQLNPSQAIPLALIINEALTNSIKYAFPGERKGEIHVSLTDSGANYTLEIDDNGIGINNVTEKSKGSLGFELMKGLSKEIGGEITIESNNGVKIRIIFAPDLLHVMDQSQMAYQVLA